MSDTWVESPWIDVAEGDFVKRVNTVYRVDGYEPLPDGSLRLTLTNRDKQTKSGTVRPTSTVLLRTERDGKLTAAGKRFDGLRPGGARALREQLGAELIAVQDTVAPGFQPWILAERYSNEELASHLWMFHELDARGAKAADAPELKRAHAEFHAADMRLMPETARRIPHVHNEEAFRGKTA